MMISELERRALLGDQQAQEECTRKWIVLQCPFCGRKNLTLYTNGNVYHNHQGQDCVMDGMFIPLPKWNSRKLSPIGRCEECAKLEKGGPGYGWCGNKTKRFDSFCSDFKPQNE